MNRFYNTQEKLMYKENISFHFINRKSSIFPFSEKSLNWKFCLKTWEYNWEAVFAFNKIKLFINWNLFPSNYSYYINKWILTLTANISSSSRQHSERSVNTVLMQRFEFYTVCRHISIINTKCSQVLQVNSFARMESVCIFKGLD